VLLTSLDPNSSQLLYFLWFLAALGAGIVSRQGSADVDASISDQRLHQFLITAIVLCAAALRFYQINFGFPNFNHPDEGPKGTIVARMLANGSFDPHYFLHPSLLLYLSAGGSWLLEAFGNTAPAIERSVLAGRIVSAVAGTVSVPLVYFIGRRLFSSPTGLCAAALLAVSPLHVTCSRYMKEDVLFTAMTLASVLFALRGRQNDERGFLYLAGVFAGFAAGSKYTGALAAVLLAAVLFLPFGSKRIRVVDGIFSLLLVPLGFLFTTPYALINSTAFLKHFSTERSHMKSGHQGVAIDAWSQWWMYHLSRSIIPGLGFIGSALCLLSLGRSARIARWPGIFIGAAVLLFYLPAEWVKAKPPPQPERYILACLPFAALAAAEFLEALRRGGNKRIAEILCFLAVVLPGWRSIELARDLREDTRQAMRKWMTSNLSPDSKILIEAWYSPRLTETTFKTKLLKASKHPQRFTRTRISETGYEYLLVNSFSYGRYFTEPKFDPVMRTRFERIFSTFELVHESKAPSGSYGFQNPTVRLYKIPVAASGAKAESDPPAEEMNDNDSEEDGEGE